MAAGTHSAEESLAWEARWASRAAIAAILAGLCTVAGAVIPITAFRNPPHVTLVEGLHDAAGTANPGPGERTVRFLDDRLAQLTIAQILTSLAAPLAALALIYLYRAIRARRPEFRQGALVAAVAGAVLVSITGLVLQIALDVSVSDFASSSDHTSTAVNDALQPAAAGAAQLLGLVGKLALAFAVVVISLNAMRVGLLTRFLGILGILAGVTTIIVNLPIVQAFWLVGLGLLFLRRLPGGTPPAWETGRAEPWPSRQDMMEQQGKLPGGRSAPAKAPPPAAADPLPPGPEATAHSRSKKKKRRR